MAERRLLYLVRHGVAEPRGPAFPDDDQRPLTADGRTKLREIGAGLLAIGVEWDEMLTSPSVRTYQTAEVLAAAWPKPPRISTLDALAVGGSPADVLSALESRKGWGQLALIGHMPGIGALAAELLGASRELEFKKGGVACLEVDRTPGQGTAALFWFAPPRILRLLAKKRA